MQKTDAELRSLLLRDLNEFQGVKSNLLALRVECNKGVVADSPRLRKALVALGYTRLSDFLPTGANEKSVAGLLCEALLHNTDGQLAELVGEVWSEKLIRLLLDATEQGKILDQKKELVAEISDKWARIDKTISRRDGIWEGEADREEIPRNSLEYKDLKSIPIFQSSASAASSKSE